MGVLGLWKVIRVEVETLVQSCTSNPLFISLLSCLRNLSLFELEGKRLMNWNLSRKMERLDIQETHFSLLPILIGFYVTHIIYTITRISGSVCREQ